MINVLTWLVDNIVRLSEIPSSYKMGLIVPIRKPKKKDFTLKNNNASICIVQNF